MECFDHNSWIDIDFYPLISPTNVWIQIISCARFFVIPSLYYCSVVHMSDRSGFNQQTVIRFVIRIQKAFKWAINCNWKLHWMPLAFWKQFSQLISCSFNFADLWHFWWSGFFYAFSKKKLMQSNVVLHVVMLTIHLCIKAGTNSQEKMEIDKIWLCFIFMGNRISTISISPIFFLAKLGRRSGVFVTFR